MIKYVYGVRIYPVSTAYILVKQTVRKTGSKTYVIDHKSDGTQKEKHIDINDDKGIADAIRNAIAGKL